jgi:hypothetical protein
MPLRHAGDDGQRRRSGDQSNTQTTHGIPPEAHAYHRRPRATIAPTERSPRPRVWLANLAKDKDMIGSLIGALIGEDIAESDGDSGAVGALLGVATVAVAKRIIPLALLGVGLLVAKHYYDKAAGPTAE